MCLHSSGQIYTVNSSLHNNTYNQPVNHLPSTELPTEPYDPISQPCLPSSIQPNIHSMTTRSKAGIFKPKLYAAALIHKEPYSVYEAMQNPRWLTAMKEEYAALI